MLFVKKRALLLSKNAFDTILSPPILVTFGNGRPRKDARLLVPPTFWARAQRVKNGDPRWGDGQGSCKLEADWSKLRFEVTTRPLIGSLFSVRDFKQTISERGLLFLCF